MSRAQLRRLPNARRSCCKNAWNVAPVASDDRRPAWPLKGHHYACCAGADSAHPNVICARSHSPMLKTISRFDGVRTLLVLTLAFTFALITLVVVARTVSAGKVIPTT